MQLGLLRLWKTDSEKNTKSKKYFWAQIRSKQYNQQYDQSNTIKAVQSAIMSERLKQYNQRYDQDNFGVGIGYIANSAYAKTRNLSKILMFKKLM